MRNFTIIIGSLLLAIILSIMPLPAWALTFRPEWVALICIYWIVTLPDKFGLISIWLLGIILDALHATLIGEHALALVVMSYVIYKFHRQFRMLALMQQIIVVFILMLVYQSVIFIAQGFIDQLPLFKWFWFSSITSAIIWPWVYTLLRRVGRYSKLGDGYIPWKHTR